MKRRTTVLPALAILLVSSNGWSATPAPNDTQQTPPPFVTPDNAPPSASAAAPSAAAPAAAAPATPAPDSNAKLSPPTREIVKMAVSGVPDDVLKAYIENSGSTFNLTSENIIHLQGVGVSSAVTGAMLVHDKVLRDGAMLAASVPPVPPVAPQPQPQQQEPATVNPQYAYADGGAQPAYYSDYSSLSPYGYWSNLSGYGWCWQPYSWVPWTTYPWGLPILSYCGYWWHHPSCGWCWCPHSHVHGFQASFHGSFVHPTTGFSFVGNRFVATGGQNTFRGSSSFIRPTTGFSFVGNRFVPTGGGGAFHGISRPSGFHNSVSVAHISSGGFRGFSQPGMMRSGGGMGHFSSGSHSFSHGFAMAGGGGHSGGGGGMRGGGGGFHR